MAFSPSFSVSQTLGEPNNITITDTSSGTDGAIISRRVYLYINTGGTLVPTGTSTLYVVWSISDSSITIDCLDKDYAINIVVQWMNNASAVLYTSTQKASVTMYNDTFDYQMTQLETANPILTNDNGFFKNKSKLRTYIDSGNQAMLMASDIYAAQLCYDRATYLRLNASYLFT